MPRGRGLFWLLSAFFLVACNDAPSRDVPGASPPTQVSGEASGASDNEAAIAASATPSAAPLPEETPEGMVKIPSGIFLMGAYTALGNPEEKPGHEAIVASFYLDVTEVTHGDYVRCVQAGGCTKPQPLGRFCNHKLEDHDDHPANCVTLHQATAYCAWAGKRLPTEREWEYAASEGNQRRRFSWGPLDPDGARNSCYDHPGGSCSVASFPPGAFGLHDMTGNVWEWTSSQFAPYPTTPRRHGAAAEPLNNKRLYVYRGGSWSRRFSKWMRNLLRNRYEPDKHSAAIGMRCAKDLGALECPENTEAKDGVCTRVRGDILCEPNYRHNGRDCVPDTGRSDVGTVAAREPPSAANQGQGQAAAGSAERGAGANERADASEKPTFSIQRTAQHDADCLRHWPKTPKSFLFTGGRDFHSRKPALRSAGCVPRDMGWKWTSACCPG